MADIYRVKDLLARKDLRMTTRYVHLAPENFRYAISVLDEKKSGCVLATLEKEKELAISQPLDFPGVPTGISMLERLFVPLEFVVRAA